MIAIKNHDMPEDCQVCFARVMAWCRLDEEERIVVPAVPWELEERPEWCPLVDISDEAGNCSEVPNNSTDCIRRQDAIDKFTSMVPYAIDDEYTHGYMDGLRDGYDEIMELPSVQPIKPERKKGKWRDFRVHGFVICPFCGTATSCEGDDDYLHFCYQCGADLRGEQE